MPCFLPALGMHGGREPGRGCHVENIQRYILTSVLSPEKQGNFLCFCGSIREGDSSETIHSLEFLTSQISPSTFLSLADDQAEDQTHKQDRLGKRETSGKEARSCFHLFCWLIPQPTSTILLHDRGQIYEQEHRSGNNGLRYRKW